MNELALTRRQFLSGGGALVVSFALSPRAAAQAGETATRSAEAKLPGSLDRFPMLDSWIRIGADGSVTVFTGKGELGQGIRTALQQVAAEQLAVPFASITMITADTQRTPNEGYTSGSNSMKDSGTAILNAAAQVRELLVAEASRRLGVAAGELVARDGAVHAPGGKRVGYGELVAGQALHVRAEVQSKFKDAGTRTVMGKPVQRVDIPAKVTGGAAYVQDLRLPGMVHARIVRPPQFGAKLKSLDAGIAEGMPGVLKVVRDGSFVAVVAEKEFQAIRAMRALSDRAVWDVGAMPPADVYAQLLQLGSEDKVIHERNAASLGAMTHEATFRRPYQLHGSIGPSCGVALYREGKLEVWTHGQGVFPLRAAIAEMLKMAPDSVHCIHMEGAGCYGHNGADDAAADAALLARALPGTPVRVQWMREEEHSWEPFGPAMVTKVRAALDRSGRISAWEYDVWSNTHSTRPGKARNLAAGSLVATPFAPAPAAPIPQPEGGGDRNAIPLYAFASARVTSRFIPTMPLRVSALRGLGAYMNVFSIESFMDELAAAAKADPVEFRLRHLEDGRARDVVAKAAQRFGWASYRRERDRGRGFAFARYKNLGAYCAIAMEVEVARETGEIRVGRIACAVDSGDVVNPDGIRNQIEGGVVQSLSWTMYEAVTWDARRITSRDWGRYPIVRFPAVPASLDVDIIDRPMQPFLGTGEAAQGPASAALANAVADAVGVRVRDIPLNPARIKALLGT
ncbi:MAG TPA: molybdopterin cofactor-binding domain-containing protein [Usitatibacter sp.]